MCSLILHFLNMKINEKRKRGPGKKGPTVFGNAEASGTSPDTQLFISAGVTVYAINNIGNRQ